MAKKTVAPAKKGAKKAAKKGAKKTATKKVVKKDRKPRTNKKKSISEDSHVKQANIMEHKNFPEYLRNAYDNVRKKINQ